MHAFLVPDCPMVTCFGTLELQGCKGGLGVESLPFSRPDPDCPFVNCFGTLELEGLLNVESLPIPKPTVMEKKRNRNIIT